MPKTKKYLLHVRKAGTGKPIIFIHGVAGSGLIWEPITSILKKKYKTISVDLLGYGFSPKPHVAYTPLAHVEAIHETIKNEGIQKPYAVVGLSMGSLLAMEYARLWPKEVSHLICLGIPYFRNAREARKGIYKNFWIRATLSFGILGKAMVTAVWFLGRNSALVRKYLTPTYSPQVTQETLMSTYEVFKSTLTHCMVTNFAPELLAKTEKPVLVVQGTHDKWNDNKVVLAELRSMPNVILKELDGIPHNTVLFAPDQTATYIDRYYSKRGARNA